MVRFAQFGAGRIGVMHARNIAQNPRASLKHIVDINAAAAQQVAAATGAKVSDRDAALGDPEVDAVLVCSATPTHVDLLLAAVAAGKPVLCEKPIDLDYARAKDCVAKLKGAKVPVLLGFNRRFDPHNAGVHAAVVAGQVGKVEQVMVVSRDSGLASMAYLKESGGIFRDMIIHDFDICRWLLGEEPVTAAAQGSVLISDELTTIGDFDNAVVTLRTASNKLAVITATRRAAYGYDQRMEVHGSEGMVQNANVQESFAQVWTSDGNRGKPLLNFFIERYDAAYRIELDHFIDCVEGKAQPSVGALDGLRALALAEAADASARNGGAPTAVKDL
jgi:myo-inositol 2-dehydrogenase / D-chiro-inositol 1-dehydrogenase